MLLSKSILSGFGKIFLLSIGILLISCSDDEGVSSETYPNLADRTNAGGATTVYSATSQAFSWISPGLSASEENDHMQGDYLFEMSFVTYPAPIYSGLGPIYNNVSCISCHPKDGRANFPDANINAPSGLFLRISIDGTDENGGPNSVPGFGTQMQNQAIFGYKSEGKYQVTYTDITETLADGTIVTLRKPSYSFIDTYIPLPAGVMISPRIGMPIFGSGLLELIPEADILALQDINDADGDGISGRANYVWDEVDNKIKIGRFGWKASVPNVKMQTIEAFHQDIGLTSSFHMTESSYATDGSIHPEISDNSINLVDLYCRTLGVPAARDLNNPTVQKGAKIFDDINCSKCHVPQQKTGYSSIAALSFQTFYPYTDMLLHDMGDRLGDGRPDYLATGNEWKTRPLWGIGLTQVVNGHTRFLHDGRARNLTEAIMWHGGESRPAKDAFKALNTSDREALLKFVNSL